MCKILPWMNGEEANELKNQLLFVLGVLGFGEIFGNDQANVACIYRTVFIHQSLAVRPDHPNIFDGGADDLNFESAMFVKFSPQLFICSILAGELREVEANGPNCLGLRPNMGWLYKLWRVFLGGIYKY